MEVCGGHVLKQRENIAVSAQTGASSLPQRLDDTVFTLEYTATVSVSALGGILSVQETLEWL